MSATSVQSIGVSVREFGACGTGETDDAPAIQRALDAGARRVVIPPGHYRIGATLRVPSRTSLLADAQAMLRLADGVGTDASVHLLSNARPSEGDEAIAVEGGVWDGNSAANPRGLDRPNAYTGVLMHFARVKGLDLRGMVLRDPGAYFTRLLRVSRFRIEQIRFEAGGARPNQDGIHLAGFCEDGVIRHVHGFGPNTPSDDIIALNADDANHRAQNLGLENGPIRRITIEDVSAEDAHTLVRLLSVASPIEDIAIDRVRGGVRAAAVNLDACRDCVVRLFDAEDAVDGVGAIRRVRISDLRAHKSHARNGKALIDLRTLADDFVIERFSRDLERDQAPATPSLLIDEIPGSAIAFEGAAPGEAEAFAGALAPAADAAIRTAGASADLRAEGTFARGRRIVLHTAGFERLRVTRRPSAE